MDKGFFKHLREKKDFLAIAAVLALGLILIFIGGSEKERVENDGTDVEYRLAEACSGVAGVGECEVFVYYGADSSDGKDRIESVIVICEGAESTEVRFMLTEMLTSFLGIGANRVRVEKMR